MTHSWRRLRIPLQQDSSAHICGCGVALALGSAECGILGWLEVKELGSDGVGSGFALSLEMGFPAFLIWMDKQVPFLHNKAVLRADLLDAGEALYVFLLISGRHGVGRGSLAQRCQG